VGSGGQYRDDAVLDGCRQRGIFYQADEAVAQRRKRYPRRLRQNGASQRFRQAQLITSRTLEVFTMYLAASLIYWVMATVLSALQLRLTEQLRHLDGCRQRGIFYQADEAVAQRRKRYPRRLRPIPPKPCARLSRRLIKASGKRRPVSG
jgi:hypothetical protein